LQGVRNMSHTNRLLRLTLLTFILSGMLSACATVDNNQGLTLLSIKHEDLSEYWLPVDVKRLSVQPNGAPQPDLESLVVLEYFIEANGEVSEVVITEELNTHIFVMSGFTSSFIDNKYKPAKGFNPIRTKVSLRLALNMD
jgi:hypothetical protein